MLDMLAMLVPMVLTLMPELMVPTTLARGLLMLSLRPRLMLLFFMELTDMLGMLLPLTPMDMLHMLLPMLMDMLLLLILMDTQDILDTLDTLMVPTLTWDKKKCFFLQKNYEEKSIYFGPQHEVENSNEFQLKYFTHSQ